MSAALGSNQSVSRLGNIGEMFHDNIVKRDSVNTSDSPSTVSDNDGVSWLIPMAFLITGVISGLLALFLCQLKRMGDMRRRSNSIRQKKQELHYWRGKGDIALIGLGNDRPYGAYRSLAQ